MKKKKKLAEYELNKYTRCNDRNNGAGELENK